MSLINLLGPELITISISRNFTYLNSFLSRTNREGIPVISKMAGRKDFLSMPAPENYVAGLGRGATGFTTRSDLGPAREGPSEDQIKEALAKRAAQLGAAPPTAYGAPEKKDEPDEDDERFQDPENETGLFSGGNFDADDDAADRIYQDVDERMEKRRKARRFVALFP